ncbi:butyrophilin-like protein 1 [Sphaeramia orbicularis]|uniref:butyrophilin-like protein 1 n=1 Tax=Sphaeramia orbicularis TaxID=375764 RepID=UPI0011811F7E|nr:butyrophilin-like protein 1 [Sphaeramia orbicularis]
MLHMMLRHFNNFSCGAFTVLSYTVLFPALIHLCTGQGQVSSPSKPLVSLVGHSVTLPCHLDPAADASQLTVEWTRSDLDPRFVLVWRDGIELESKKNPSYTNRTTVSPEKLKLGDASLRLSSVRLSDEGTYRCFIPQLRDSKVPLVVGAASSPVITTVDDQQSGGVVLQCRSSGWYPEPQVLWLDEEGNLLSAGHPHTQTVRGPDDLYTISSTVTVDNKHQNITCRITQNGIAQTRDTHVHVPGHSSSSAPLLVAVIALVLSLIAVAFIVHRCKQRNKKSNQGDVESQKGEEKNDCESPENTPLLKTETDGGKRSEKEENERTKTQEERRQQGQEEQETVQNQRQQGQEEQETVQNQRQQGQEEQETVQNHGQRVNEGAELQTGTQQHGHTCDGNVENGDADSDGNMGGDEPPPVSHSKDPLKKQDEDKTQEEDPEVQRGSEETGAQVQKEEENHEEQLQLKAEKEEKTADEKLEPLKNKLKQIEREKKKAEDAISRKNENIKDQENQLNELKKQKEEVERRLQEEDMRNKTEKEREDTMKDLEKKKEELQQEIQKLEKGLERNQREKTHVETKKLKLEKEKSEIMTKLELPKQREEDEEEDEDEDL